MKYSKSLILGIYFLTLFLDYIIAERLYRGYKVYTVKKADNITQYDALVNLQRNSRKVDFWSDPSKNRKTDIMVPPEEIENTEKYLKAFDIDYDIAIPDVQGAVEKEKTVRFNRQGSIGMNWREYHRLRVIHEWMDQISAHNPSIAQIGSIGRSTEGRDLKLLRISANPGKNNPMIFIDGGIHAREWISPAVVTYVIGKLMSFEPEDQAIFNNLDWYFVPVVNPDGYEFTHTEDRLWRKSRSRHNGAECIGVDLNRNFDFHWGEQGVKDDPCANTYPGPSPFSEPEANATAGFMYANRNRIRSYITFHSYSQLFLTPYGYTEDLPDDYDDMEALGQRAARALTAVHGTEYSVGAPSHILYLYSGSSQDWAREYGLVKYAYTIELRDEGESKFLLPDDEILPTGEETWAAIKVIANHLVEEKQEASENDEDENENEENEAK